MSGSRRHADAPRLTAAQRRRLFALAGEHGWTIDQLRGLTPRRSISALTIREAAALIDRLDTRRAPERAAAPRATHRPPRLAPHVVRLVTARQHAMIDSLAAQLRAHYGWSQADWIAWAAARHLSDGRPITDLATSRDGAEVIQLLTHVLRQARDADQAARQSRRTAAPARSAPPPVAATDLASPTITAAHRRPRLTPPGRMIPLSPEQLAALDDGA